MSSPSSFAQPPSLAALRAALAQACLESGRQNSDVNLLGASKTVPAPALVPFVSAGLLQLGENYIQEGVAKRRELEQILSAPAPDGTPLPEPAAITWHFIGALQSNKAREAVTHFDLIHTVDRASLVKELEKEAARLGKVQRILLQMNLGAESSKAGVAPEGLVDLWRRCRDCAHLQVQGLMSLPPFHEDAEAMRPYHRALREYRDAALEALGLPLEEAPILSMGMSNDFSVAIAEGATHIRVGTALFGARSYT